MSREMICAPARYTLALALTCLAACWPSPSYAAEKVSLRAQYKAGQELAYQLVEQTTLGSEELGLKETLTCDLRLKCISSNPQETQLAIVFDRIQFSASGDVGGGDFKVAVDTKEKRGTGSGAPALQEYFSAIVGAEIRTRIDARGRADQPTVPEPLLELFRGNNAKELAGFFYDPVSNVGLSRRLYALLVVRPEGDVAPDDAWDQTLEWDALYRGQLQCKLHYTYVGTPQPAGLHKLRMNGDETISNAAKPEDKTDGKLSGEYELSSNDGTLEQAALTYDLADFCKTTLRICRGTK
jgi:hypothetical protein